jgi:hypothetical protein
VTDSCAAAGLNLKPKLVSRPVVNIHLHLSWLVPCSGQLTMTPDTQPQHIVCVLTPCPPAALLPACVCPVLHCPSWSPLGRRAAPAASTSAPKSADPEPEPAPRPKTPSKLELAAAAAVAANAASTPRATPIELPVVTLSELEQAMGAK